MLPADQRFGTDHRPGPHVDLGLVIQQEFFVFECLTDAGQPVEPLAQVAVLGCVKHMKGALARLLGLIHRLIGMAQQGIRLLVIQREQGNADAGRYRFGLGQARQRLFDIAKQYKCNKIALGHHQDDLLQTLLMNMTFQGAFGTMPPRLKMDKFDMTLIRPLCLVEEKELIRIAEWKGYKKLLKNCPHESTSSRPDLKGVLARLEEINPHARYNLWGSMTHIQKDYLPRKKEI